MKTVKILSDFTGYPNGKKRAFVTGETPELANDYADLLVGKDLALEIDITPAVPAKPKG